MIDRPTDLALVRARLQPRRRPVGAAPVWEDDACPAIRGRGFAQHVRSRGPGRRDPAGVPAHALAPLKGLVVLDEIQHRRDLLPLLRVLADRKPAPARFLILSSAAVDLIPGKGLAGPGNPKRMRGSQSTESLAGRLETVHLEGFQLRDLGAGARPALAAGRACLVLHGQEQDGLIPMASTIPADVPGARRSTDGHPDPRRRALAVLEHAGPCSRPDLQRRRAGPGSASANPRSAATFTC